MCGRYALVNGARVFATFEQLKNIRESGQPFDLLPRYNASPMQRMPVIAVRGGERVVQPMQWWLVPHWSKDGKTSFSTFNAKSETLAESRLFAPYFKGSRCLVPADAFYEWKRSAVTKSGGRGKAQREIVEKHPMCIRLHDKLPFMFAGLFSVWKNAKEEEFPTFTLITTGANELVTEFHHRMPVILPAQHFDRWLDREEHDTAALSKLLVPYPSKSMQAYPVSDMVNNARNDTPECLEPVAPGLKPGAIPGAEAPGKK